YPYVNVSVKLGQFGWGVTYTKKSICVLKGSTVDLACTYKYPWYKTVKATFWFTKNDAEGNPVSLRDDPDYKGRVEYSVDKRKSHTLTITDLRESDSAEYWFTFTTDQTRRRHTDSPGVTLSVTGLQVKVTVSEGQRTLTCSTTCILTDNLNPIYIWYKNGQNVKEDSSSMYSISSEDADSYYCAVKGHDDLSSPAVCEYSTIVPYSTQQVSCIQAKETCLTLSIITKQKYFFYSLSMLLSIIIIIMKVL
uniref:Ig-like domain-containing protein n=1 Tax=Salmo trutta TaxID=8032 RepID=A0A674APQ4_SALTR